MAKAVPIDKMFNKLSTKQKLIKMAEEIIGMMIERTQRGYGVDGTFEPYAKSKDKKWWHRKYYFLSKGKIVAYPQSYLEMFEIIERGY